MKNEMLCAFLSVLQSSTALAGTWALPQMAVDERPRVLFGPGEEGAVRSRLGREPYASIYAGIFERASSSFDLADHSISAERHKGNVAQAAALVYALDRTVRREGDALVIAPFASPAERAIFGRRAETLVQNMIPFCRMLDYLSGTHDIHCAQELTLYATAYDLLAGAGYPFADAGTIEDRLATFTADFFSKWTVTYWTVLTRAANENHGSKTAAAIGLAAIVLNGYDRTLGDELDGYRDPRDWIDFGLSFASSLGLDALCSIEGAYGEGPVYFRYAAINLAVFFWAWHRYTRGGAWEVDGVRFVDPWGHPYLQRVLDWLLAIQLPDGTCPPFDDSTPGVTFFWGPFVGLPNGPAYRWAWERGINPYDVGSSVDQSLLTLVAFDDAVVAARPDFGPSVFLPEGGQAVFRSGWEEDAVYLIVQAEHGVAGGFAFRYDGEWLEGAGSHEHSDPGTTHLMAYGERLVIDSGYLGWKNHSKVREPENHNLVLIDGKGPQNPQLSIPPFELVDGEIVITDPSREGGWIPGADADAYLRHAFAAGYLEHARVDARYHVQAPPSDWQRRLVFVDGRYFIQADVVVPDDGDEHRFELLTHLNAGGTSGGEYQAVEGQGARVLRPTARLELRQAAASGAPALTISEDIHDAWRWREETHTVLRGEVNGTTAAFLTVLYPSRPLDADPEIERLASDRGLAAFAVRTAERHERFALSAPEAGERTLGDLRFTGSLALVSSLPGSAADRVLLADGTALRIAERAIRLDQPGTVAIHFDADRIAGHYAGPANRLTISGGAGFVGGRGFCSHRPEGSDAVIVLGGPGAFVLLADASNGNRPPVAVAVVAGETKVGLPVELDASASCDADSDPLRHAWRVVDAPVRSRARIEEPSASRTRFVPDWAGHYRIGLTVSDETESSQETTVLVWVERAEGEGPDGGIDGDGGDLGDNDSERGEVGGCACGRARPPARWALLSALGLVAALRRRSIRRSP